jgi:hypothetical protein
MTLTYTGLFLFALLLIAAGAIYSRIWRKVPEDVMDWDAGDVESALATAVVPAPEEFTTLDAPTEDIRPVERVSDLVGCKQNTGDLRCDVRGTLASMGNGKRWSAAYPTVRAYDMALTFLGDSLITSAPDNPTNKQWMDAIRKATDNLSMVFDATKKLPSLDSLEGIAKDAWQEGCFPT